MFTWKGESCGISLQDFWAWGFSDLLNNTLRGALAEFLVLSALGIRCEVFRKDWTPYDMISLDGKKIEVKSSAYLQSWNKERQSKIIFSIRPSYAWDAETNYSSEKKRWSDLYVFCVYAAKTKEEDPMHLEQWEFYLLPTRVLDQQCKEQKSISLSRLLTLHPVRADYQDLRKRVEEMKIAED